MKEKFFEALTISIAQFLEFVRASFNVETHVSLIVIEPGAEDPMIIAGNVTKAELQTCANMYPADMKQTLREAVHAVTREFKKERDEDDGKH